MKEIEIHLKSVRDVLAFVNLATKRSFTVTVSNGWHHVSGKSFLEMVCMTMGKPAKAMLDCSEEEFRQFLQDAQPLLAT